MDEYYSTLKPGISLWKTDVLHLWIKGTLRGSGEVYVDKENSRAYHQDLGISNLYNCRWLTGDRENFKFKCFVTRGSRQCGTEKWSF